MSLGQGVIKGMGLTLRHFFKSYVVGHNEQPAAAGDVQLAPPGLKAGMPVDVEGLLTVEYPDVKLPTPERFRYMPFLVFEEDADSVRAEYDGVRCTACGICSRVCPPQCIWIVQARGENGRPKPVAAEFYIDAAICMSCGLCAEFCPFDAIKMDHQYELSSYERHETWVHSLQELLRPLTYHAAIHPTDFEREERARRAKEEALRKRAAAKAGGATEVPPRSGPGEE